MTSTSTSTPSTSSTSSSSSSSSQSTNNPTTTTLTSSPPPLVDYPPFDWTFESSSSFSTSSSSSSSSSSSLSPRLRRLHGFLNSLSFPQQSSFYRSECSNIWQFVLSQFHLTELSDAECVELLSLFSRITEENNAKIKLKWQFRSMTTLLTDLLCPHHRVSIRLSSMQILLTICNNLQSAMDLSSLQILFHSVILSPFEKYFSPNFPLDFILNSPLNGKSKFPKTFQTENSGNTAKVTQEDTLRILHFILQFIGKASVGTTASLSSSSSSSSLTATSSSLSPSPTPPSSLSLSLPFWLDFLHSTFFVIFYSSISPPSSPLIPLPLTVRFRVLPPLLHSLFIELIFDLFSHPLRFPPSVLFSNQYFTLFLSILKSSFTFGNPNEIDIPNISLTLNFLLSLYNRHDIKDFLLPFKNFIVSEIIDSTFPLLTFWIQNPQRNPKESKLILLLTKLYTAMCCDWHLEPEEKVREKIIITAISAATCAAQSNDQISHSHQSISTNSKAQSPSLASSSHVTSLSPSSPSLASPSSPSSNIFPSSPTSPSSPSSPSSPFASPSSHSSSIISTVFSFFFNLFIFPKYSLPKDLVHSAGLSLSVHMENPKVSTEFIRKMHFITKIIAAAALKLQANMGTNSEGNQNTMDDGNGNVNLAAPSSLSLSTSTPTPILLPFSSCVSPLLSLPLPILLDRWSTLFSLHSFPLSPTPSVLIHALQQSLSVFLSLSVTPISSKKEKIHRAMRNAATLSSRKDPNHQHLDSNKMENNHYDDEYIEFVDIDRRLLPTIRTMSEWFGRKMAEFIRDNWDQMEKNPNILNNPIEENHTTAMSLSHSTTQLSSPLHFIFPCYGYSSFPLRLSMCKSLSSLLRLLSTRDSSVPQISSSLLDIIFTVILTILDDQHFFSHMDFVYTVLISSATLFSTDVPRVWILASKYFLAIQKIFNEKSQSPSTSSSPIPLEIQESSIQILRSLLAFPSKKFHDDIFHFLLQILKDKNTEKSIIPSLIWRISVQMIHEEAISSSASSPPSSLLSDGIFSLFECLGRHVDSPLSLIIIDALDSFHDFKEIMTEAKIIRRENKNYRNKGEKEKDEKEREEEGSHLAFGGDPSRSLMFVEFIVTNLLVVTSNLMDKYEKVLKSFSSSSSSSSSSPDSLSQLSRLSSCLCALFRTLHNYYLNFPRIMRDDSDVSDNRRKYFKILQKVRNLRGEIIKTSGLENIQNNLLTHAKEINKMKSKGPSVFVSKMQSLSLMTNTNTNTATPSTSTSPSSSPPSMFIPSLSLIEEVCSICLRTLITRYGRYDPEQLGDDGGDNEPYTVGGEEQTSSTATGASTTSSSLSPSVPYSSSSSSSSPSPPLSFFVSPSNFVSVYDSSTVRPYIINRDGVGKYFWTIERSSADGEGGETVERKDVQQLTAQCKLQLLEIIQNKKKIMKHEENNAKNSAQEDSYSQSSNFILNPYFNRKTLSKKSQEGGYDETEDENEQNNNNSMEITMNDNSNSSSHVDFYRQIWSVSPSIFDFSPTASSWRSQREMRMLKGNDQNNVNIINPNPNISGNVPKDPLISFPLPSSSSMEMIFSAGTTGIQRHRSPHEEGAPSPSVNIPLNNNTNNHLTPSPQTDSPPFSPTTYGASVAAKIFDPHGIININTFIDSYAFQQEGMETQKEKEKERETKEREKEKRDREKEKDKERGKGDAKGTGKGNGNERIFDISHSDEQGDVSEMKSSNNNSSTVVSLDGRSLLLRLYGAGGDIDGLHSSSSSSPSPSPPSLTFLPPSIRLFRSLKFLDGLPSRECHKIGVVYVGEKQENQNEILQNDFTEMHRKWELQRGKGDIENVASSPSPHYFHFLHSLGTSVDLRTHRGFLGGLDVNSTGPLSTYYQNSQCELMFHVVTQMDTKNAKKDKQQINKKKQVGNDHTNIIWNESKRDYRPSTISSEFNDCHIIIQPLMEQFSSAADKDDSPSPPLFRVDIIVKKTPQTSSLHFGPLPPHSTHIIPMALLGPLVRLTAINSMRAIRALNPNFSMGIAVRDKNIQETKSKYGEGNHNSNESGDKEKDKGKGEDYHMVNNEEAIANDWIKQLAGPQMNHNI